MKLLVNTQNVLGHIAHNNEEDIAHLHGTVLAELEDWVDDGLRASFGDTTFGSEQPENVKLIARMWNSEIRLAVTVKALVIAENPVKELPLDSDFSHGLYLAARAADNQFSAYGNCGVLADNGCGFCAFSTILTDEKLAQVEAKPEEWVALTVQVC